jgi:hypothetical protein
VRSSETQAGCDSKQKDGAAEGFEGLHKAEVFGGEWSCNLDLGTVSK